MNLASTSFRPWETLDTRLAFARPHASDHVQWSDNRNPQLAWSNVPDGTRSFALLCWDDDVPTVGDDVNQQGRRVPLWLERTRFFHWVVADLPATLREVAEGTHSDGVTAGGKAGGATPDGGVAGINDYTGWFAGDEDMRGDYFGYDGPCPPWNDERTHAYVFTVLALDVASLGLSGAFTGADLLAAAEGHVLASAAVGALYRNNAG
jgi:Raf kinase inhibitor-like YbhB/YbcL family protein